MARQAVGFVRPPRWSPGRRPRPEPVAFPPQRRTGARVDEELAQSIMQALRRARDPVLESVLYERVRGQQGGGPTPEHFLAVLERLLMAGHTRLSVEREPRARAEPPFQSRYYRPAD
jgi:hypothetical protein